MALNGAHFEQACGAYIGASETPLNGAADPDRLVGIGSKHLQHRTVKDYHFLFPAYHDDDCTLRLCPVYRYLVAACVSNGRPYSRFVPGCGCDDKDGRLASLVFTVQDPSLDIRVMDATLGVDATSNGWITTDTEVEFRITTNLYQISQRPGVPASR